ncbi:MAG TPA: tetratricopeptide repeat protein [Archangium sp.]|nr:tetratricopeptide repeat protein [Archangium sp.]
MRRPFIALSLATSLLGGCSSKDKPEQPSVILPPGEVQKPPTEKPPQPAAPQPEASFLEAMKIHAQGRVSGESGNFPLALQQFQKASELAPKWPQPVYDIALTHLLAGDVPQALAVYARVDQLAPEGFSDTKRVMECLRREQAGRIPKGTFRKFIDAMRSREQDELEKKLEQLTRTAPTFYPAWREFAPFGKDVPEQLRRLEKGLALQPDPQSQGEMLVYKANLLRRAGKEEEARKLLQSLVEDPKSLPGTVTAAKEALSLPLPP